MTLPRLWRSAPGLLVSRPGKRFASGKLYLCYECDIQDFHRFRYQVNKEHPTGKCAVLITGQDRSLVTKLDAANHFTTEHLEPNWDVVEKAKFFYSSGFFLTVSPDSMVKVGQHAAQTNKVKTLCFDSINKFRGNTR